VASVLLVEETGIPGESHRMEKLDEASKPDVPYPYEMSARGNAARVNRYLPQPIVSNLS
jgi:hypothetical protein